MILGLYLFDVCFFISGDGLKYISKRNLPIDYRDSLLKTESITSSFAGQTFSYLNFPDYYFGSFFERTLKVIFCIKNIDLCAKGSRKIFFLNVLPIDVCKEIKNSGFFPNVRFCSVDFGLINLIWWFAKLISGIVFYSFRVNIGGEESNLSPNVYLANSKSDHYIQDFRSKDFSIIYWRALVSNNAKGFPIMDKTSQIVEKIKFLSSKFVILRSLDFYSFWLGLVAINIELRGQVLYRSMAASSREQIWYFAVSAYLQYATERWKADGIKVVCFDDSACSGVPTKYDISHYRRDCSLRICWSRSFVEFYRECGDLSDQYEIDFLKPKVGLMSKTVRSDRSSRRRLIIFTTSVGPNSTMSFDLQLEIILSLANELNRYFDINIKCKRAADKILFREGCGASIKLVLSSLDDVSSNDIIVGFILSSDVFKLECAGIRGFHYDPEKYVMFNASFEKPANYFTEKALLVSALLKC